MVSTWMLANNRVVGGWEGLCMEFGGAKNLTVDVCVCV